MRADRHVLGGEPRVHAENLLEAGEQQAGADQQDERERDLRDDQHAACLTRTASRRASSPILAQDEGEVQARKLQRGHRADDQAEQHGEAEGKSDHDAVHADFLPPGQVRHAERRHRAQRPCADGEAQYAAQRRQQHGLRQELPRDAAPCRADGMTRGQLLHPPARAHERQVRDVHRRDQQHEQRATPQQVEHRLHVAHDVGGERREHDAIAGVLERLLQRPACSMIRAVIASICDCACATVTPSASRATASWFWLHRDSSLRSSALNVSGSQTLTFGLRNTKFLRHHTDDGEHTAVEPDGTSDDVRAGELTLPEPVAQDGDLFVAGLVVLVGKEPASERTRPERVEQRRRHFSGLDVLGLARFADVDAAEAVQRHRLERVPHLLRSR
jgi:hypothetical protein